MKKRHKIIVIVLVSIVILFLGIKINNINKLANENEIKSKKLDINPISKENVIKIIKAEYGEYISTTEEDIEIVGEEYVVDVYVDIKESEEDHQSHEHSEVELNRESLGIHKIDMFSGELKKPR